MVKSFHKRLGTAGLIVAIIALVAALAGGAYAASGGLTSKQKKQVKKIAQTEAKKFATGGPQGPAGPQGAAGPAGKAGANGSNGSNGKSVVVANEAAGSKCSSGGVNVEVEGTGAKQYVCNGKTGYVESLPGEASLKGIWGFADEGETFNPGLASISFGTAVSPAPTALYVAKDNAFAYKVKPDGGFEVIGPTEVGNFCPGTAAAPAAEPGFLCVFVRKAEGVVFFNTKIPTWGLPTEFGILVPVALENAEPAAGFIGGTWAVTAE